MLASRAMLRVALACAAIVLTASSASAVNLTGTWTCFGRDANVDTATYNIRQVGNELFWLGQKDPQAPGRDWANVAHGRYNPAGNAFDMSWADIRGPFGNAGTIIVRYSYQGRDILEVVGNPGAFGTRRCVR